MIDRKAATIFFSEDLTRATFLTFRDVLDKRKTAPPSNTFPGEDNIKSFLLFIAA